MSKKEEREIEQKKERLKVVFDEVITPLYEKLGLWKLVQKVLPIDRSTLDDWRVNLPLNHPCFLSITIRKEKGNFFPSRLAFQKIMTKKAEIFSEAILLLSKGADNTGQETLKTKEVLPNSIAVDNIVFPLRQGIELVVMTLKSLLGDGYRQDRQNMREEFPGDIMELQLLSLAFASEEARKIVLANNPELLSE